MSLTENGLSPADIMAMTNSGNESGFGGTWTWVFFLFFLLAWGGGGLFGNNGTTGLVADALTQAELFQGLGQQDVFRNQSDIARELSSFERDAANRWGSIQYEFMQQLAENRFAQQSCCQSFMAA